MRCSARATAGASARARTAAFVSAFRMWCLLLEEVPDRELEVRGVVDVLPRHRVPAPVEREPPLEPERADRAEPTEPEPHRLVKRPGDRGVAVLARREGVARVGEEDAPDPDVLEQRELELEAHDRLLVSPDGEQARPGLDGGARRHRDLG